MVNIRRRPFLRLVVAARFALNGSLDRLRAEELRRGRHRQGNQARPHQSLLRADSRHCAIGRPISAYWQS